MMTSPDCHNFVSCPILRAVCTPSSIYRVSQPSSCLPPPTSHRRTLHFVLPHPSYHIDSEEKPVSNMFRKKSKKNPPPPPYEEHANEDANGGPSGLSGLSSLPAPRVPSEMQHLNWHPNFYQQGQLGGDYYRAPDSGRLFPAGYGPWGDQYPGPYGQQTGPVPGDPGYDPRYGPRYGPGYDGPGYYPGPERDERGIGFFESLLAALACCCCLEVLLF